MPDDTYQQCPRCNDLTEAGDHFPCADGTAYHVLCYQAAMVEAGQPNPFPFCDYCEQLVWETSGPASLIVKGQVFEAGDWRPARWHIECAPGEESPEIVKDGELAPELPDRIDEPPPQPQPRVAVPTTGNGGTPDGCPRCGKPVQRSRVVLDGHTYHKLCAEREAKTRTRQGKHVGKVTKAAAPAVALVKCVQCNKKITPSDDGVEPIECETPAGVISYHKRCYRAACIASGQPDPFPKADKPIYYVCGVTGCGQHILREEFRAHVEQHEASDWAGTGKL